MPKRKVAVKRDGLKTYIFRVVLEEDRWPDEPPSAAVWRAYVPSLESLGAATWGKTQQEALKNIQEVLEMIIEELEEEGATRSMIEGQAHWTEADLKRLKLLKE